jgi:hypothetical protein
MPQPQPALPTKRAFVALFRVQPSGAPMAWDGRAEHVGLKAGDTLLRAGRVTAVHAPRPGGSAGPVKCVGRALPVPERPPVDPLAGEKEGATRSTHSLEKQGISRLTTKQILQGVWPRRHVCAAECPRAGRAPLSERAGHCRLRYWPAASDASWRAAVSELRGCTPVQRLLRGYRCRRMGEEIKDHEPMDWMFIS